MKILYISSVPSKNQFNYMKSMLKDNIDNVKYGMQESGFKFHHLVMEGIIKNKNEIYSLVGRPVSRHSHKGIFWKNIKENEKDIFYEHIAILNIPILKNIFACVSYFFKTKKWLKKNKKEDKCIIIDAAYVTIIPFINLATKIIKCKKVAVVCDIYEYMADVKDSRENKSKIHKYVSKIMKNNYLQMDGFVFLTEAMNDVLNKRNVPYIVMEGLVDSNMKSKNNTLKDKNPKDIVMYAGAIREKYGLKYLIDGYSKYNNNNSELWIYGSGDYVSTVEKYAKKDKRIKYYGIVDNKEIVKREIEATLLINPRPTNLEFTKYSFPSKNMEYMVSGTPILTSKLPGMPDEYLDYVYLINENSSKGITDALNNTLSKDKEELHKKGIKAKKFVLDRKNNIVQAKRILDLCEEVVHENI